MEFNIYLKIRLIILIKFKLLYQSISDTTSDVYFQVNTQTFSVCESTNSTQTPNLPWSFTGSTSITYSLSSYKGSIVPSFVSINSTTGILTITAPWVTSSTDYTFSILSAVSGFTDPAQTIIKLSVKNCTAGSCSSSEVANLLSAIIQGVMAATVLLIVGLSLFNLSSLASLWSAISQVQILHNRIYKSLFNLSKININYVYLIV